MRTILVALDQGLAHAYFLETDLTRILVEKGARLVYLVPKAYIPVLAKQYSRPQVTFDCIRDTELACYWQNYHPGMQQFFEHVRRASASTRIPLTYVDTHRRRNEFEASGRYRAVLIALRPLISLLRHSRPARRLFRRLQGALFTPHIYDDLFDQYQPDLLVCNTAGWRLDQYLMREAIRRKIKTLTTVVGWDNPSSHGLPGAFVDYVNVWSEVHKWEMTSGVDWPPGRIHVGGMPLYDGYLNRKWLMPRKEYFSLHRLDPKKKLIAFAASTLSVTPNYHVIEELARLVGERQLAFPAQLLIRLHPNHFKNYPHYREEARAIRELIRSFPDVHIVEPSEVPGGLERYSGEDYQEKGSMLAYCDTLVTVYSTMVVEAMLHDKPVISACIDTSEGWPGKYWVPMHTIPTWPTARRFNKAGAGRLALSVEELQQELNAYLSNPGLDRENRRKFVEQELTYLNGEATQRTADFIWALANGEVNPS